MLRLALFAVFSLTLWSQSAPPDSPSILRGVEKLYNSTNTLQANFALTYRDRGRPRAPERGVLYLSKQGAVSKTRWEYSSPAGKLFLSDGKFIYDYDKEKNSADRYLYKETEDLRVPLSFLLGKLDFNKDFERFGATRDGANTAITMTPRNKKLLFKEIAITVAPDSTIRRVIVTDQGGSSSMDYALDNEQRNLKLADALFKFNIPGAQVVDVKQ
jgi:outer membrane lipoprotein carrier protein